ncbi:MAG: 30S ribosomal protein S20 [Eubacteriales bacterium]
MPNIKSAKKRVLTIEKRTLKNRAVKTNLKTRLKNFDVAVKSDDPIAKELLRDTVSAVDKAAKKGVIHKNKANRKKSRMAKALNKAQA